MDIFTRIRDWLVDMRPSPSKERHLDADKLKAAGVALVVVVSGYDVVAAQTIHGRKSYDHTDIRFGQRYADILEDLEDGRVRIDYSKFHDTLDE